MLCNTETSVHAYLNYYMEWLTAATDESKIKDVILLGFKKALEYSPQWQVIAKVESLLMVLLGVLVGGLGL